MDKVDKINDTSRRKFLKEIAAVPAVALAGGTRFGLEATKVSGTGANVPAHPCCFGWEAVRGDSNRRAIVRG